MEKFKKYGKVLDVYIPRNRADMSSRGFAFVTFVERRDAEDAAEEMNEYHFLTAGSYQARREIHGRLIKVNIAKPRPPLGETRRERGGVHLLFCAL